VLATVKTAAMRRLRRWPSASLDRGCARRASPGQVGTEKRCAVEQRNWLCGRRGPAARARCHDCQWQPTMHADPADDRRPEYHQGQADLGTQLAPLPLSGISVTCPRPEPVLGPREARTRKAGGASRDAIAQPVLTGGPDRSAAAAPATPADWSNSAAGGRRAPARRAGAGSTDADLAPPRRARRGWRC
jgi:hypothetical protein